MFRRWFVVAALLASVPAPTAMAQSASSVQQLNQQAMTAYVDLELDRAQALLERALVVAARDGVRGTELARTHMNLGVLAIAGRGDSERGLTHFLDALEADPSITPDPATSTPDIASVFRTARERTASQRATASASTTTSSASAPTSTATPTVIPDPSAAAASTTLAGDASSAHSDDAGANATEGTHVAPTKGRASRLHVHGIGVGYHTVMAVRSGGSRYGFSGPTVAYDYFVGKRWGFMLHGEAWFPLYARQTQDNGTVVASNVATDYPAQHYGFDGLVMAARRMSLGEHLVLTAAVGAHAQAFVLHSVVNSPVELISIGVGGLGKLEWLATSWLSIHGQISAGIDPLDAIRHVTPVVMTIPVSASLGCTVRY